MAATKSPAPLVRTWECPKCPYRHKTLNVSEKKPPKACPNDGATLRQGVLRRERYGYERLLDEQIALSEQRHIQGDPIAAWQVFSVLREMKRPIPGWVLTHFENVGKAISGKIRLLTGRDRSQARALSILGTALGFRNDGRGGRGDVFSKHEKAKRDAEAARLVEQLVRRGQQPKAAVIEVAGWLEVSTTTVSRAYYTAKRSKSH